MSDRALWEAVESYTNEHLGGDDQLSQAIAGGSEAAGLPRGAISAGEGRFLELIAHIRGARRILEIGTLGGYSTAWLARALPAGGRLVTLELDPGNAEAARTNLATAGLGELVEVRVGPALDSLRSLAGEGAPPFDLIFIDADKQNNPGYLEWALRLSRPGTVIVADNVVRAGRILDPDATDPRLGDGGIEALRRFYEQLGSDPRLEATVLQTVGSKGHDGFALAVVADW
jgi:predicted O-methyltransferase YrrM